MDHHARDAQVGEALTRRRAKIHLVRSRGGRPTSWITPVLVAGLLAVVDGVAEAGDPLFQAMRVAHVNGDVEAPAFELPTTDGQSIALAGLRGRLVLLNFWATWCAPCREEMPSMERLYQAFKDRGLVVLAVNLQESPKQVARFMRNFRLTFPALLDADLTVTGRYQVRGLPATFLIDRQGRVVGQALGARDWSSAPAQALVESLLAAQAARP